MVEGLSQDFPPTPTLNIQKQAKEGSIYGILDRIKRETKNLTESVGSFCWGLEWNYTNQTVSV